ncbi:MAG: hypothetical protein HYS12_19660 [Planctomycetes bacterium]|nr:hypothetical protein [Planctomycetota bacterium]
MHPPRLGPIPPVPTDVSSFAASQGAGAEDVQTILKMTRRLFPTALLSLRLKEDSDYDDSHIVVEVDARGYDDMRVALAQTEWADELFQQCPSSHVCLFRLAVV